MPKQAPTDLPNHGRPSALEMFTDRIDEREVLARCLAPHDEVMKPKPEDFITVVYGVGGVGKSTLCRWAIEESMRSQQGVLLVMLDLDSSRWNPASAFGHLLAALVPELVKAGVQTPLTQALLLMYAQADSGAHIAQGASGAWNLAVGLVDQATQAAGIPGVSLLLQGAQWLRDRKRQGEVRMRLQNIGLWPEDLSGGSINLLDLEGKLALALYNDLKDWAVAGRNLRILLDGFERIQSRERRCDCQKLLQDFAGFIASSADPHLSGRVRLVLFGRDKLRWEELYDDPDWVGNWNQHLLEGLGEQDALDFIQKRSDWLEDRGDSQVAVALKSHADAILDAADEGGGQDRRIYPYYLDMAVDMVCDSSRRGREPDLGRTPSELQDRFFRYLSRGELHLLKILAIAETFDAPLFDDLVLASRVSGFAVGSFLSSVVQGRSYILAAPDGSFRFHRLMENGLQDLWIKSDVERSQAKEVSYWLLDRIELALTRIDRKEWGCLEIESWRRGLEIIVTQAYERGVIDLEEADERLERNVWGMEFPIPMELALGFHERIWSYLEMQLRPNNPKALSYQHKIAVLRFERGNMVDSEEVFRRIISARVRLHPDTFKSICGLAGVLCEKGEYEGAEALYREELGDLEQSFGINRCLTLCIGVSLIDLLNEKGDFENSINLRSRILDKFGDLGSLIQSWGDACECPGCISNIAWLANDVGNFDVAEFFYRRALSMLNKDLGGDLLRGFDLSMSLGVILVNKGDFSAALEFYLKLQDDMEKALGSGHPYTLYCSIEIADLTSETSGPEKARDCYDCLLHKMSELFGEGSPMVIECANRKGNCLRSIGLNEEAGSIYRKYMEISERTVGPEAPSTLGFAYNLGSVLHDIGDLNGAEVQYRRALEGQKKIFGISHESTQMSIDALKNLLVQRDYLWLDCDPSGIDGMIRVELEYGCESPELQEELMRMGDKMYNGSDYLNAEIFYRRAMEIRKKVLGAEDQFTLSSAENLRWALEKRGEIGEVGSLLWYDFEAKERTFGKGHHKTIDSMGRLGRWLEWRGDCEGAESLYRRALEVVESRIKGVNNDWCSNAMIISSAIVEDDFIPLLKKMGKSEEAEILSVRLSGYWAELQRGVIKALRQIC
jgi:tetratricopeptide (TPR) repeat protein